MNPKFSVIIPTYNRASLIEETIDSVLNQTYKDFQILVIDDCSTDNTKEVLARYIDSGKIVYYKNETNRERAYSRNKGLELAKSDYVTFLDSDDVLFDNCLQDAFQYISQHPTSKMFHSLYEKIDVANNTKQTLYFPPTDDPFKALSQGNFLSNIGVFIHKDIYKKIHLDEAPILTFSEDYDYYLRALILSGQIGRINKVCGILREHTLRSTNTIQAVKKIESIDYLIQKNIKDPEFVKAYNRHIPDFISYLYLYLGAQYAIGGGDFYTSIKYIFRAAVKRPSKLLQKSFYHHLAVVLKYQLKRVIKNK